MLIGTPRVRPSLGGPHRPGHGSRAPESHAGPEVPRTPGDEAASAAAKAAASMHSWGAHSVQVAGLPVAPGRGARSLGQPWALPLAPLSRGVAPPRVRPFVGARARVGGSRWRARVPGLRGYGGDGDADGDGDDGGDAEDCDCTRARGDGTALSGLSAPGLGSSAPSTPRRPPPRARPPLAGLPGIERGPMGASPGSRPPRAGRAGRTRSGFPSAARPELNSYEARGGAALVGTNQLAGSEPPQDGSSAAASLRPGPEDVRSFASGKKRRSIYIPINRPGAAGLLLLFRRPRSARRLLHRQLFLSGQRHHHHRPPPSATTISHHHRQTTISHHHRPPPSTTTIDHHQHSRLSAASAPPW
jgi:hypothetical protein